MRLTRRTFLDAVAGVAAFFGFGSVATAAVFQGGSGAIDERTFAAFVDTLIPEGEGSPAASQLGVEAAILAEAAANAGYRQLLAQGTRWLDGNARNLGARGFADLGEDKRVAIVERAAGTPRESGPRSFFDTVRERALFHYYGDPRSWAAVGYEGPPQPAGFPDYVSPPEQKQ